jgi:phosphate:Na+ symporter
LNSVVSLFAVFIAIFLFGMTVMRIGLNTLSKQKIKQILLKMTDSPLKGLIVGIIVTAIVQSSSAVMVMTVGLVAAGIMTFRQSIGIILGSNIGTTLTAELITLDIHDLILPLLVLGVILLNLRQQVSFCIGCIFFGLGCLFVAMQGFENLAFPLAAMPAVQSFIQMTNENELIGIGIGTFLTAIIQSSSAMTGIVMGFLNQHIISLPAGIAIVLGANIGTCITAYLASFGTRLEAKLVAYAHIWINLLGVVLFFPFIQTASAFVTNYTTLPDLQLAHVSVLFNAISSLIVLPLAGYFAFFITKLHGERK